MVNLLGLTLSIGMILGGSCVIVSPELLRKSMGEDYSAAKARAGAAVVVALGIAGLFAILRYHGDAIDFFPATLGHPSVAYLPAALNSHTSH